MNVLLFFVVVGASYLVGSIPVGLLLGKALKGVDIREHGSGRTGATNALRTLGWLGAVATLLGDIAKGCIGVLIGQVTLNGSGPETAAYGAVAGALAAIAGHNWPIYTRGRGGRGVATTLGAALIISPLAALLSLPVAVAVIVVSDMASLGSLVGTLLGLGLIGIWVLGGSLAPAYAIFALVSGLLIFFQHRDNIQRLCQGKERKLGLRKRTRNSAKAVSGRAD